ncbi:hypothetical protein LTR94_024064, partial [Friedmanniomyces endolithicus]
RIVADRCAFVAETPLHLIEHFVGQSFNLDGDRRAGAIRRRSFAPLDEVFLDGLHCPDLGIDPLANLSLDFEERDVGDVQDDLVGADLVVQHGQGPVAWVVAQLPVDLGARKTWRVSSATAATAPFVRPVRSSDVDSSGWLEVCSVIREA